MKLEGFIADLLKQHNCVIVPDFGGFVTNYKSATIDRHRKKIHPPSKSVLFNPLLTNNDGLLCNYIAQQLDLTYSDALDDIYMAVNNWNSNFQKGERIEIGEIGFLYRENGKIHFEQSREVNLLMQSYGLRSVDFVQFEQEAKKVIQKPVEKTVLQTSEQFIHKKELKGDEKKTLKPVEKESPNNEPAVIQLDQREEIIEEQQIVHPQTKVEKEKTRFGIMALKYTAAAAVVPILFYSYWIPMETDALETKSVQLSDFNPIHQQVDKLYKKRSTEFEAIEVDEHPGWEELTDEINATVYNYELAEDFYIPVLLSNSQSKNPLVNEQVDVSIKDEQGGPYHVISGCFSVHANAEGLVSELRSQGFDAHILDKSGGLHRVSAGDYSSRQSANEGLDKVKNNGHSAWVLKK